MDGPPLNWKAGIALSVCKCNACKGPSDAVLVRLKLTSVDLIHQEPLSSPSRLNSSANCPGFKDGSAFSSEFPPFGVLTWMILENGITGLPSPESSWVM